MSGTKDLFDRLIRRRAHYAFIHSLPPKARVLDVGCGNNSPYRFKALRPDCYYVGIDVGDYNQMANPKEYADEYVLTDPAHFAEAIRGFNGQMDAVISSHNLEHCDSPVEVLDAMARCLMPGGRLYLAFPCEESVHFPSRRITLNFFDDPTHRSVPEWEPTLAKLVQAGLVVDFQAKRYRVPLLVAIGLLCEPISALFNRTAPATTTWALYGFESIIWASKPKE